MGQKRLGKEIWCGGKNRQKEEEKKGGGVEALDSSEFGFSDYLLGVMVRVSRFVSDGVSRGLAWYISDAFV